MESKIYEYALRKKLRFSSRRGNLTMEDLWDLPLEELDVMAIGLNAYVKDNKEAVSYIGKKTEKENIAQTQFDIVKNIIDVKLSERAAAQTATAKREQKQKLLSLIAEKKEGELATKSVEDLMAMLKELD